MFNVYQHMPTWLRIRAIMGIWRLVKPPTIVPYSSTLPTSTHLFWHFLKVNWSLHDLDPHSEVIERQTGLMGLSKWVIKTAVKKVVKKGDQSCGTLFSPQNFRQRLMELPMNHWLLHRSLPFCSLSIPCLRSYSYIAEHAHICRILLCLRVI